MVAKLLTCKNIIVDAQDCKGTTALCYACMNFQTEIIVHLLEAGASVLGGRTNLVPLLFIPYHRNVSCLLFDLLIIAIPRKSHQRK